MSKGALPGFRDFYPDEFAERASIFRVWRQIAQQYGFVEYDGPPLEPLGIYTKKSGDEIVRQLYTFVDKGERDVALRPEMTPTFVRMIAARANAMPKPIKWFSIPQLFRYERTQRGRLREHFQLNVDVVGETSVSADAEILSLAIDIMREFGLSSKDLRARVSDRELFRDVMLCTGVPEASLPAVTAIVDRIDRTPKETVYTLLKDAGLTSETAKRVPEVIYGIRSLSDISHHLGESLVANEHLARMSEYFKFLRALGVDDWVDLDLRIVRGLAYYTGIVFELFDAHGKYRAICGGGRYDKLLEEMGGPSLPALGFGMGDVVLGELLRDRQLLRSHRFPPHYWVAWAEEGLRERALQVACVLRRQWDRRVEYSFKSFSLTKQLRAAQAARAQRTLIIGSDRSASVKWMDFLGQRDVNLDLWLEGKELMVSEDWKFFVAEATFTPKSRLKKPRNPLAGRNGRR